MSKYFVSVLILNYNNEKLLKRSINSCLNQTYKNLEILIYDDQSKDKSLSILKKYNNKSIKIFSNKLKKIGIPALDARNGYYRLIKHSKGQIIFLLDSDDYFKKNKVYEVVSFFKKEKEIDLVQDLPLIQFKNKKKKNLNNPLSFWPYLAPESCISFRKKFIKIFLKKNIHYENSYKDVWLGFRLGVFAYFVTNSFQTLNKNLTVYKSLGESKKYKFLSFIWFYRRLDSYNYLNKISNNTVQFKNHLDYLLTKIMVIFLKLFK